MLRLMYWTNFLRRALRAPYGIASKVLQLLPAFDFIKETKHSNIPISFDAWFRQQVMGINYGPYWPVDPASRVIGWRKIYAGVGVAPGFSPGCYIQALGELYIGDYTIIAPNVGIISSNHTCENLKKHDIGKVVIGRYCWIGMGAIILPGVTLGDFTTVGAGAIVTRSFPQGYCVIGGNPAKIIKKLDKSRCISFKDKYEYHGFIPKYEFEEFRKKNLLV